MMRSASGEDSMWYFPQISGFITSVTNFMILVEMRKPEGGLGQLKKVLYLFFLLYFLFCHFIHSYLHAQAHSFLLVTLSLLIGTHLSPSYPHISSLQDRTFINRTPQVCVPHHLPSLTLPPIQKLVLEMPLLPQSGLKNRKAKSVTASPVQACNFFQ